MDTEGVVGVVSLTAGLLEAEVGDSGTVSSGWRRGFDGVLSLVFDGSDPELTDPLVLLLVGGMVNERIVCTSCWCVWLFACLVKRLKSINEPQKSKCIIKLLGLDFYENMKHDMT